MQTNNIVNTVYEVQRKTGPPKRTGEGISTVPAGKQDKP